MRRVSRRAPRVREVAVCTKAPHGKMPIGMVHARTMERGSRALKDSPHGPFGYSVRLRSIIGRSVMPVAEFSGRLRQLWRIVGLDIFNFVIRPEEFLHGGFNGLCILVLDWKAIDPAGIPIQYSVCELVAPL